VQVVGQPSDLVGRPPNHGMDFADLSFDLGFDLPTFSSSRSKASFTAVSDWPASS